MSNVIVFKREKWCAGPVKCFQCKREWVAVWPKWLLYLYCPECNGPHGLPLDEPRPSRAGPEPVNSAILPNGSTATNVYEAYEEGLKEGSRRNGS
jgi:hypothetical protein